MTSTEDKAQALVNACGGDVLVVIRNGNAWVEALCRAIEQHEAFRQEVSDAVKEYCKGHGIPNYDRFIIPKPKPDPLVEALAQLDFLPWKKLSGHADDVRAALDALGFEIREKTND